MQNCRHTVAKRAYPKRICDMPRPALLPALSCSQPPAALRKAIGQQLIVQALERKTSLARRSEPADLVSFGELLEANRAKVLLGMFICAQVRVGASALACVHPPLHGVSALSSMQALCMRPSSTIRPHACVH